MNAFVTGSRVYGTPREDSDIDLCVVVSSMDANRLRLLADSLEGSAGDSVRFGKLNLLFLSEQQFPAWKEATVELISRSPVDRDTAIKTIDAYEAGKVK